MRAIVVEKWTEPADLTVSEIDEPCTEPGSLRIEVRAAGCNFADTLIVQGKYQVKPTFPFVPGAEVAGTVAEVGDGVEGFRVGDRVLASATHGGFAERVVMPASACHRIPDAMSFEEGAALPIIYPTSYAALVDRGHLAKGEDLLIHAAAGGVGLAAVQIGKALGARVIATAGGAEKLEIAREHGAHDTIDYREEDFVERVLALTDGKGADVIYDSVGGDTFDRSLKCIAWNGRLLVVGFASGTIPTVKVNRIMLKNIAVTGIHWPAWSLHQPEKVIETFDALFRLYEGGGIRPVIFDTFPLERVADALVLLAGRKTHGKIIITP
jgi:NADPH2:quinone reductase